MRQYILLAAAGQGKRLQSTAPHLPKQFHKIAGRPLLAHTLLRIQKCAPQATYFLVLPKAHTEYWEQYCKQAGDMPPHNCVMGGPTRFASVRAGIEALSTQEKEEALVAIHDGVRPLLSAQTLKHSFELAAQAGTAVCVLPLSASIRKYVGKNSTARNRNHYCLTQTPQTFRLSWLQKAFSVAEKPHFSDEATVVEEAGYPIHLLPGDIENRKITYAEDLAWLRWRLQQPS